jgi:hypothetical protein
LTDCGNFSRGAGTLGTERDSAFSQLAVKGLHRNNYVTNLQAHWPKDDGVHDPLFMMKLQRRVSASTVSRVNWAPSSLSGQELATLNANVLCSPSASTLSVLKMMPSK